MKNKNQFPLESTLGALDDLIHSKFRLAIMTILMSSEKAQFTCLKKVLKTTDGNLSVHITKLEDAGYISVEKRFVHKRPQTTCKITARGRDAFEKYVDILERIIKK
jgi:DNA-binding MarR family transcriptional regulator